MRRSFFNKLQFLSINEQALLLFEIQYALINRYAAATISHQYFFWELYGKNGISGISRLISSLF